MSDIGPPPSLLQRSRRSRADAAAMTVPRGRANSVRQALDGATADQRHARDLTPGISGTGRWTTAARSKVVMAWQVSHPVQPLLLLASGQGSSP